MAGPPAPFSGEFGNRLHFGLHIVADAQFRLSNLVFNLDSTDSGNTLDFAGTFAASSYSATRVGIDYVDGIKGNGNDIVYTSGTGTAPINELIYVGVGNAEDATFEPGATNQDKVDSVLAYINSEAPFEFDINMTYTLKNDAGATLGVGTSSVQVVSSVVPEPTSMVGWGMFAVGAVYSKWSRRRRYS